jgi:hypothetical protein
MVGFWWGPPQIAGGNLLTVSFPCGKRAKLCSWSIFLYRQEFHPHYLTTTQRLHLLIPLPEGLEFQHTNWGEHKYSDPCIVQIILHWKKPPCTKHLPRTRSCSLVSKDGTLVGCLESAVQLCWQWGSLWLRDGLSSVHTGLFCRQSWRGSSWWVTWVQESCQAPCTSQSVSWGNWACLA